MCAPFYHYFGLLLGLQRSLSVGVRGESLGQDLWKEAQHKFIEQKYLPTKIHLSPNHHTHHANADTLLKHWVDHQSLGKKIFCFRNLSKADQCGEQADSSNSESNVERSLKDGEVHAQGGVHDEMAEDGLHSEGHGDVAKM